jgi:hypothetical protein
MGSLIYINDGLENSPYKYLLDPSTWEDIEEEFIKNVCKLMGLSTECPLTVWYKLVNICYFVKIFLIHTPLFALKYKCRL